MNALKQTFCTVSCVLTTFIVLLMAGCRESPTVRVTVHPNQDASSLWEKSTHIGEMNPNTKETFSVPRNAHLFAGEIPNTSTSGMWEMFANNNSHWEIPPITK